jgi:pimeloyl-ACP methyl ester carboxylesterase
MKIRNLNFNVRTLGTGLPFVWSHGMLSSMETEDRLDWFQWGTFPTNLKLIRYDARGHGKTQATARPEDYTWRNLGQDMLAVVEASGEHSYIAGGASMGAMAALYAAMQSPGRVQAMVLAIPPLIWDKRVPQREVYLRQARTAGLLGGRLLTRLTKTRVEDVLPGWMVAADPERYNTPPETLAQMSGGTLGALLRGAADSDLPTRETLAASLRDIPALIISWADDPGHPLWSGEELRRHLPKSELFVVKGYDDFQTIPLRIRRFITTMLHYQPPPIHF